MNILITGANGFIGNNIVNLLSNDKNLNIYKGTRTTIDLYSQNSIENYLNENRIDSIIHCAIEGGSRLKQDPIDIVYKNILMYQNLMKFNDKYKIFINLASGAEYDRTRDINDEKEYNLFDCVPTDYYGLSKNIISKLSMHYSKNVNLRIFNCFYHNEMTTRFIKNNINNYINNKPIIIHQDRYMDFFYMEDLIQVINYFLNASIQTYKDVNMSYMKKYKLSDIGNIINNLSSKKVDIIIEKPNMSLGYSGNGEMLNNLNLNFKGIDFGINNCYNHFLNQL